MKLKKYLLIVCVVVAGYAVVQGMVGNKAIKIVDEEGDEFFVTVSDEDWTIKDMKSRISAMSGREADTLDLMYENKSLRDDYLVTQLSNDVILHLADKRLHQPQEEVKVAVEQQEENQLKIGTIIRDFFSSELYADVVFWSDELLVQLDEMNQKIGNIVIFNDVIPTQIAVLVFLTFISGNSRQSIEHIIQTSIDKIENAQVKLRYQESKHDIEKEVFAICAEFLKFVNDFSLYVECVIRCMHEIKINVDTIAVIKDAKEKSDYIKLNKNFVEQAIATTQEKLHAAMH